jgi:hypothetical protein
VDNVGDSRSCAIVGLEGALVKVEVDLSNGMPGFMIVGFPDAKEIDIQYR